MERLWIVVQTGFAIRNILRTEAYNLLKSQKNLEIVLIASQADSESFQEEFGGANVKFLKLHSNQEMSGMQRLTIQMLGLSQAVRNPTSSYKIRIDKYREDHKWFKFSYPILKYLLKVPGVDGLLRAIDKKLFGDKRYKEYFREYPPTQILFTGIYDYDAFPIMRMTSKRNIPSITFVSSWDNLTKGAMIIHSENIIVWNKIMQKEAIQYYGYEAKNVHVTGAASADYFVHADKWTKKEFCKKMNLDPSKKIILYVTVTKHLMEDETYVLRDISKAITEEKIEDAQVLARVYARRDIEEFKEFHKDVNVTVYQPRKKKNLSDLWSPDKEIMDVLVNSLIHADVVVGNSTTMLLDAMWFDAPVIGLAYDKDPKTPYESSCKRFFDYAHFKRLVDDESMTLAKSKEELFKQISQYLKDPSKHLENRKKVADSHFANRDGKAGVRIATAVKDAMRETSKTS